MVSQERPESAKARQAEVELNDTSPIGESALPIRFKSGSHKPPLELMVLRPESQHLGLQILQVRGDTIATSAGPRSSSPIATREPTEDCRYSTKGHGALPPRYHAAHFCLRWNGTERLLKNGLRWIL